MIKHIKQSLALSRDVAKSIDTADLQQLDFLKQRLIACMGSSPGWHTFSIPMVCAIMFALFSFLMPQFTLWEAIFRLKGWPDYAVLAAIYPMGIVYGCFLFLPAFLTARGLLFGLRSFMGVILFTALIAVAFFCYALISYLTGAVGEFYDLLAAVLGLLFIAISIRCLNSVMCTKTIAFYLLNRVSRNQIIQPQKSVTSRK